MPQLKAKGNLWQCLGKVLAVFAVFGTTLVTASQAKAVDHYIFQQTSSGKTAYWEMNTNGGLRNQTEDEGFGMLYGGASDLANTMTGDFEPLGIHVPEDLWGTNRDFESHLLWTYSDNSYYYWTLNSNGVLKNGDIADGWDFISPCALPRIPEGWKIVKVIDIMNESFALDGDDYAALIVQQTASGGSGNTAFLRLDEDGYILNITKGNGWDMLQSDFAITADTGWEIGPWFETGHPSESDTLLLMNSSAGKVGYWRINSNGTLQDTTEGSGWGVMGNTTDIFGSGTWRLAGLSSRYDNPNNAKAPAGGAILYLHEPSNSVSSSGGGRVAWWALNSNGVLQGTTAGTDWGYVSLPDQMPAAAPWEAKFVHPAANESTNNDHIVLQNSASGNVAFIEVNSENGSIRNTTAGEGFGFLWPGGLSSDWQLQLLDDHDGDGYNPNPSN